LLAASRFEDLQKSTRGDGGSSQRCVKANRGWIVGILCRNQVPRAVSAMVPVLCGLLPACAARAAKAERGALTVGPGTAQRRPLDLVG